MSRVGELWSRRWVRVVVKTALGLVAVRVLVTLLAPLAISFAARSLELRAEYDELSLSVFSGSAQLSGLAVRAREDADDAPPMLAVGYGLVDVSMLSLLRGELHVERAEIDDVHARVERRADGCVPWVRHLGLDQPAAPKKEVPKEPQPLDFTSPVRIDALRALRVGIELVDASVTPAIDEELVCELRISDLGAKNGVATFEA
ncbi:MAG: hypothetical protein K8S98_14890, partial [Planctomycetes bacterium]|nr:hypothetical protein [Planctomycetota bacterium]